MQRDERGRPGRRRAAPAPLRTSVLWGAVAALAALASGLVVEGGLSGSRLLFAVLLGPAVGLAHAALAGRDPR